MVSYHESNQDKSAARFCCQVAAWVPDMFFNFYLVKSHKIVVNSPTIEARVRISADLESLDFYNFFDVCLLKFENDQILLNLISYIFLVKTKLLRG